MPPSPFTQSSVPDCSKRFYEVVFAHELRKRGLRVERQVPIPIFYDGLRFEEGFRADLVVEDKVTVELKSVETLLPVHAKQVLTQIKLTNRKLGLLINFGADLLKDGIKRIIHGTLDPEEVTL